MRSRNSPKQISQCLELAVLLEASADKPGNVNRTAGFQGTRYEHFLASAVALSVPLERAAERGLAVSKGEIQPGQVGVGSVIKHCVTNINAWQHGGNTLLGSVLMLSPLAAAAAMTPTEDYRSDMPELRKNLRLVIESTTPEDAVNVYEAIRLASPGGLGESAELDINDPASVNRIRRERIPLHQVFKIAEKRDTLCAEWVNNYPVTFNLARPALTQQLEKGQNLDQAIVHSFLKVLAQHPDTLIARKTNTQKAKQVSTRARQLLNLNLQTRKGKQALHNFDRQLRKSSNQLNPGTTADIITTAIALLLLNGYRP
jgi:triphosphoribosyl-dephospho-CoA synthase